MRSANCAISPMSWPIRIRPAPMASWTFFLAAFCTTCLRMSPTSGRQVGDSIEPRQAIGTATLPPNQVLVGLALMTTFYVMTPVGEAVYADSLAPYMAEEISGEVAFERGVAPVRDYLLAHTREEDLLLFVEMRGGALPEEPSEVALPVLMPAYMISEIRTAFEIGFMIYLPFLVVDLVIASMLISLGMIMLPPVMIALPFKLMLFVLVDGWNLTLSALVTGLG